MCWLVRWCTCAGIQGTSNTPELFNYSTKDHGTLANSQEISFNFSEILKKSEVWKNTKNSSGLKRKFKRSCWTLERSPKHVFFEWNRNSSANLSGQIQAQIQAASNPTEFQVFINFLKILVIFQSSWKFSEFHGNPTKDDENSGPGRNCIGPGVFAALLCTLSPERYTWSASQAPRMTQRCTRLARSLCLRLA